MLRFLRSRFVIALLTAVGALGVPRAAHAGFSVKLYEDGALKDTYDFNSPGSFDISKIYTDFKLVFTAVSSNAPGDPAGGELTFSSLHVTSTAGATHHVWIDMSDTFTAPGSAGDNMTLTNALTVVAARNVGASTVSVTSSADAIATAAVNWNGSVPFAGSTLTNFTRGSTYTLSQHLDIGLGAGADLTLQSDTVALLPAPSSLILLLSGAGVAPLGAAGWWLRRRKERMALAGA